MTISSGSFPPVSLPEASSASVQLATFTDTNTSDTAADFSAIIGWGDTTASTGTVTGGNGTFTVSGSHAYADERAFAASVTLTDPSQTTHYFTELGTITVTDADALTAQATTIVAPVGASFNANLATFGDTNTANAAGDFTATIDWGDAIVSAGTVSSANGAFTVSGTHTYASPGAYPVQVTLSDDPPSTATAQATTTAEVDTIQVTSNVGPVDEGVITNGVIGTIQDSAPGVSAGDFTATVDWGDGTTESASVTGSAGSFQISTPQSTHFYADEATDTATITVGDPAGNTVGSASNQVTINEGDVLSGHSTPFEVQVGETFSRPLVTFTDTDTANDNPADFTVSIDWDDGTPVTAGTITGGNGAFTVSGSHTFAAGGQYEVHVFNITDDTPGTAVSGDIVTVNVNAFPFDLNGDAVSDFVFQNNGAVTPSAAGTPQVWLWNGTAVTSQVTFPDPGASWHVVASRDLNGDGTADLVWQDAGGTPGIWLMNGTTPIAEVGLGNPGPSWHLVAAGDAKGDVNNVGKADLIWQSTDGTLGVWLMNGTKVLTEAGLANPGPNWQVVGAADYNGDGNDDILLQDKNTGNLMVDLMNGTAIGSTTTIAVGDPSWHAVSTGTFNGQAEIAWQNSNGAVGLWLMNGTAPVAEAGLGSPGAGWQLVSVDHFTATNGQADLLFQNTNGAAMLWEMNGTSIAATVNLPNPGAGWQSVNGHPFAVG
ncbi:MAG: VCBS repeat-containing protein [Bradyrhizobiaceae bacterium]|nr:VCBS repeat-containing protein [Hyphomicrobiales bacterium]MBV9427301.1 VCBS repeat-containing protein [Bradyrhizobiaceae bacterium]